MKIDAIAGVSDDPMDLLISSREEGSNAAVKVGDRGLGWDAEAAEKILYPFFTTKAHGIGIGLSISRSIVESHGGRLWATPCPSGDAISQFTLPIHPQDSDG